MDKTSKPPFRASQLCWGGAAAVVCTRTMPSLSIPSLPCVVLETQPPQLADQSLEGKWVRGGLWFQESRGQTWGLTCSLWATTCLQHIYNLGHEHGPGSSMSDAERARENPAHVPRDDRKWAQSRAEPGTGCAPANCSLVTPEADGPRPGLFPSIPSATAKEAATLPISQMIKQKLRKGR